jgi:hypothetical protein
LHNERIGKEKRNWSEEEATRTTGASSQTARDNNQPDLHINSLRISSNDFQFLEEVRCTYICLRERERERERDVVLLFIDDFKGPLSYTN